MLLYYPLWMFMGFTSHFYIIFGTNLLTGGPARIAVFLPISVFQRKGNQTESKRDETFGSDLFGTNANLETWSGCQATTEAATRVPGTPPRCGRAPNPRGPLERPPTYFVLLHIPTYLENIRSDHEKLFRPP